MSKKNKPKISSPPKDKIPTTDISSRNTKVIFSFEYLDDANSKYSMDEISDNRIAIQFYKELYKKMNEYGKLENFRKEICNNGRYRDTNHIHLIDWSDPKIREINFSSLPPLLMDQIKNDCWQLGINGTTFRMHGFFIENIFYIVWLDPLHKLYFRK